MLTNTTIMTVTDMRKNADELLDNVARAQEPIAILRHNKLQAYLLSPNTLENLEAFVEDYLDNKLISQRLGAGKKDFESFWKSKNLPR
ncbi:MAG: type II toxin-antitoxin system Phd/YefM family antitoxin [bacterium]|nr:type II toxin-antitoxin system Phd/YefM family antitoxin [bacterium]